MSNFGKNSPEKIRNYKKSILYKMFLIVIIKPNKWLLYNMVKKIRLTESDIHRIVKESVKQVLKEDVNASYERDINVLSDILTDLDPSSAKFIANELWYSSAQGDFDFSTFVEYLYRHINGDGY